MNYNYDRRGGYGDSTEEAANLFSATTRNPWQVGSLNAGNTSCNTAGMAEAGTGQGANIIFQGYLGGRGCGGTQPTPVTGLNHTRWDLNPVQLGENTSSGNQRDVDQDQAKWNTLNPSTRLRGQLDDDELLGFSVDQRPAQQNPVPLKLSPSCNVVYMECQKNQALEAANHCVDGCGEFMRRGRDGQETLQCMACGCHRSYHRSVRVGENGKQLETDSPDDLRMSLSRIETVALNLMEATGRALPLLAGGAGGDDLAQKELDTVMKISIENLDHISKVTLSTVECIGILQAAGNTTQQSANSRDHRLQHLDPRTNPDHGRLSSEVSPDSTTERRRSQLELSPSQQLHPHGNGGSAPNANPGKPKRKRTQFSDEQRGKMKAYAESAGWTIVGQRTENIAAACKDIGVTPKTLKYWIHNAKQKLKRSNEQPA